MTEIVSIKNLTKKYGAKVVLSDLDLTINQGDLIYLKGINGSGKSTLLKCIVDLTEPDHGEILVAPNVTIGAVIENPGYMESETILENLRFLANLTGKFNKEYVQELCQNFQLDLNSKTPMKGYSVGMRQKTAIIQAIMEDQDFIMLDEPSRGLDDKSVDYFVELMNSLHEKGKTIIIAAHDFLPINYNRKLELKEGQLHVL